MKKKIIKALGILIASLVVGVFLMLDSSEVLLSELGEVDWLTLIRENLAPRMVEALTLVISVYVSITKSREKLDGASAKFDEATESANASAKAANESAALSAEARAEAKAFQEKLLLRMEELERKHIEDSALLREQAGKAVAETEKTAKMLTAAVAGMRELVANGVAREVLDLAKGDDDEKEVA